MEYSATFTQKMTNMQVNITYMEHLAKYVRAWQKRNRVLHVFWKLADLLFVAIRFVAAIQTANKKQGASRWHGGLCGSVVLWWLRWFRILNKGLSKSFNDHVPQTARKGIDTG